MPPPLDGLRVLDLSTGIAGPYAAKLMADYGARVIKAEMPGVGDPTRNEPPFPDDVPHPEKSGLFLFLNTGKEGITLDMESSGGRDLLHRLVGEVDVLLESYPPSKSEALGLTYDQLSEHNPALVVASVTDFGREGPSRDHRLTDLTAFAASGFMHSMGDADRPPVRPGGPFAGFITGQMACFASLMAYLESLGSGLGQQVDVSMLETIASAVIYEVPAFSMSKQTRKRHGNWYHEAAGITISIQPTRDGHVGFLVGPGFERWRALWETLLGRPEVLKDHRFLEENGHKNHGRELEEIAQEALKGRTSEEWFHDGQALRLLFGKVMSMEDLFHCEHLRERGYFQQVDHPVLGSIELPGFPLTFSETPHEGLKPSPTLGQHNQQVYSELRVATRPAAAARHRGGPLMDEPARRSPALEGLRVVDLSMGWAGPLAAMVLSDFGAQIIKVESITHLDWWRSDFTGGDPDDRPYEKVPYFIGVNRNKFDCTLDLTKPRALELLKDLISIADVLVENFTPRVMSNFGLTYDVVSEINPSLIMLSMPAFGSSGPWRDYGAYGNTIDVLAGVAGLTGYPDRSPILASNAYGDPVSGIGGAIGLSMALVARHRTGRGQHVELSHQDLAIHHVSQTLMDFVMNGRVAGRQGNRHPWMSPHGVYPCKGEDSWIAVAVATEDEWSSLCRVLGHPEAADDPRFLDLSSRSENQDELDALLGQWTAGWEKSDLTRRLQESGVSAAPVNTDVDMLDEPQLAARSSYFWQDRKYVGSHPYPGVTARLSATPGEVYMPAPTLGEHNQFVLGEVLGLSQKEIDSLQAEGIIGDQVPRSAAKRE